MDQLKHLINSGRAGRRLGGAASLRKKSLRRGVATRISRLALAVSIFSAASACASSDAPTAPVARRSLVLVALSPTQQAGLVGEPAWRQPVFEVRDENGRRLLGASPRCAVAADGGSVSAIAAIDNSQLASCSDWILDARQGEDTLIVSVAGANPLHFVASAHDSSYFDIYLLRTIGGNSVPFPTAEEDALGNVSNADTLQSAQYWLSPDGSFKYVWDVNGVRSSEVGVFTQSGGAVSLYRGKRSPGFPYSFAAGSISGDSLTVHNQGNDGFDDDVYVRRK